MLEVLEEYTSAEQRHELATCLKQAEKSALSAIANDFACFSYLATWVTDLAEDSRAPAILDLLLQVRTSGCPLGLAVLLFAGKRGMLLDFKANVLARLPGSLKRADRCVCRSTCTRAYVCPQADNQRPGERGETGKEGSKGYVRYQLLRLKLEKHADKCKPRGGVVLRSARG